MDCGRRWLLIFGIVDGVIFCGRETDSRICGGIDLIVSYLDHGVAKRVDDFPSIDGKPSDAVVRVGVCEGNLSITLRVARSIETMELSLR